MTLLAPNGKPSNLTPEQYRIVRTHEFISWFGDWEKAYETGNYDNVSKVIDEETKEPLVVYHGTDRDFNVFDKNRAGELETIEGVDRKIGIYFSNKRSIARFYTKNKGKILEVFLCIKTPLKTDKDKLSTFQIRFFKESGDDGIIWNRGSGIYINNKKIPLEKGEKAEIEYIVFEPEQIKLADGTNTTFDKNNPDIRYDYGGVATKIKMPSFIAPNGNRSNLFRITAEGEDGRWVYLYDIVRTPEFKNWFGDWEEAYRTKDYDGVSKIIDENGEPLICYHTTNADFWEFSDSYIGSKTDAGFYGKGFYFTEGSPDSHYGQREIPCFLNIRNPFIHISTYRTYQLNTDELKSKGHDGVLVFPNYLDADNIDLSNGLGYKANRVDEIVAYYSEDIKLADATNTKFDKYDSDIRYSKGGMITEEEKKEIYKKWKDLVNMSASELKKFMDSEEGKVAGLSKKEADKLGIDYGRESAKWILKMKDTPVKDWTPNMWRWAKKQISFNSRMRGNKGKLYDEKGRKTRKHLSLLIWGHNPEKYENGGILSQILEANEVEGIIGRKLNLWNDNIVFIEGKKYKKMYLKPFYERVI
jgi:hypothetical protein